MAHEKEAEKQERKNSGETPPDNRNTKAGEGTSQRSSLTDSSSSQHSSHSSQSA